MERFILFPKQKVVKVEKDQKGWRAFLLREGNALLDPTHKEPLRVVAREDCRRVLQSKYWTVKRSEKIRRRGKIIEVIYLDAPFTIRELSFDRSTLEWVERVDGVETRRAPSGPPVKTGPTEVYVTPWLEYTVEGWDSKELKFTRVPAWVYAK